MSQDTITLPAAADFHLHLRQDEMMRMVTPMVSKGGVSLAYIMVRALVMRVE
jgi:dihydroorotase